MTVLLAFAGSLTYGQQLNNNWRQEVGHELEAYKHCKNTATTGVSTCNNYIGQALTTIYKVNDFYSKELGRYMLVSEISSFLQNSNGWSLLGHGYEQQVLDKAQNYANTNKAVVAIYLNEEGIGHLSVIVPGELRLSGSWGYKVPNSAAFFVSDPSRSYMDKALSYSFDRSHIKNVLIYARNY